MTNRHAAVRLGTKIRIFVHSLDEDERRLFLTVIGGLSDAEKALTTLQKSHQKLQRAVEAQHLRVQQQIQDNAGEYTAISNIMKTKHDTVKNSIANVR